MTQLRVLLVVLLCVLVHATSRRVMAQAAPPSAPAADTTNAAAVVTWIRQAAVPLRSVRAASGFADLEPLKRIWKDVRIVGLGESTHGTREFVQVKHRLLEFLVREMGFTALAIEDSYANSQPINEYVLHGTGDRASVLTGQGWIVWDNEEMAALIDWMRSYNASVPEERKVRFHGMDVRWNDVGQAKVLEYMRKVDLDRMRSVDSVLRAFAHEEARRPVEDTAAQTAVRTRLQRLESDLIATKDALVARSSPSEFESALQYIRVMQRGVTPGGRGPGMAKNLEYIIDHERPSTKFVLWAADDHLGHLADSDTAAHNVGRFVREKYGDQYYAVATAFNQGSYQTRVVLPGQPAGDLKEIVAPPAPVGSLPWYLSRAGIGDLFLDLHALPSNPVIERWASTPLTQHGGGWASTEIVNTYRPIDLGLFDGIIFVETSTPTRPTPNARRSVANRVRL